MRRKAHAAAVVTAFVAAAPAAAQPNVDRGLYQGALRQRGSELSFCIPAGSPTAALDRAVATELAASLLLDASFSEVEFPQDGIDENFQEVLFIALSDDCDVAMGMTLDWDPLPDWLLITASYYDAPYLLIARADQPAASLADIPAGARVASPMFTGADMTFITYLGTVSAAARPHRLPYDTAEREVDHLSSGRLSAAVVFGPALRAAVGTDLSAAGLKELSTGALALPPRATGGVILARDRYLQTELDRAIAALRDAGVIDRLVAEAGLPPER